MVTNSYLLVSSFHVLSTCFLPMRVSLNSSKSPASNSKNPEAVTPPSALQIFLNYTRTSKQHYHNVDIPESVLQSFSLTPFDLSHLKNSSSVMPLLKFSCCAAGAVTSVCT